MAKRISKEAKAIADAHMTARVNNSFDNPKVKSIDEVMLLLREGKTFEGVMNEVETRFCSVGSLILNRHFDYASKSYRSNIYKGFRILLDK